MSVHYKFKSALEYDTVTFDGLHISVKDLKNAIVQQKRIGKNTDFDLQVTNAQTKEVYEDEQSLIPKNTSLLIARVPLATQNKAKTWEGYSHDNTPALRADDGGPAAKAVDLSSLDAPESDKIMAMMSQSTQDYDPSNYLKIRGANQVGQVPPNYRCYKCHQAGHWIKDCPLSQGTEQVDIKKSTGIPRSFMVEVEGPQVQGAMMTPYGSYAVPALDHQTYTQRNQPAPPPVPAVKPDIPDDLICSICSDLLTDAVMIPCCGNSFCDECIRSSLLESEDHECPDCHDRDISPGTLIPNRFLRNSVTNFKGSTGYVKRQVYKPAVLQEFKEKTDTTPKTQEAPLEDVKHTPEEAPNVKVDTDVKVDKEEDVDMSALNEAAPSEKTIISEADSTEPPKTIVAAEPAPRSPQERLADAVLSELPPGVSPTRERSPENHPLVINSQVRPVNPSHTTQRDRASPRRHQRYADVEERPGTPTIDEPGGGVSTAPVAPALAQPPPVNVNQPMNNGEVNYRPYVNGPPSGPTMPANNLNMPPMHHMQSHPVPVLNQHPVQSHQVPPYTPPHQQPPPQHYGHGQAHGGIMHGPPPNYRMPPPNQQNYMMYNAPPRPMYEQPRPPIQPAPMPQGYGYNQARPRGPRDYPPRPMNPRTPPGIIDDPLEAFNRMLREKDERERRAKAAASRKLRSYSRSSSRSYSRSPPPRRRSRSPRRRSRSRSKSFSLSRSRSRSYSPNHRGSSYRDYSPRRRPPSRYRSSPQRSPKYRFKDGDRERAFDGGRGAPRERDHDRERDRERERDFAPKRDVGMRDFLGPRAGPSNDYHYGNYHDGAAYDREKPPGMRNPHKWSATHMMPPHGQMQQGGRDAPGYYPPPHQEQHHPHGPPPPHAQQHQHQGGQHTHHQGMPPYLHQQAGPGLLAHPPASSRYPTRDYPLPQDVPNAGYKQNPMPLQPPPHDGMMQQPMPGGPMGRHFDDVLPPGTDQPLPPGEEPPPHHDLKEEHERMPEVEQQQQHYRDMEPPRNKEFCERPAAPREHDSSASRDRDKCVSRERHVSHERDKDKGGLRERKHGSRSPVGGHASMQKRKSRRDAGHSTSRERERDRDRDKKKEREYSDDDKVKKSKDKKKKRDKKESDKKKKKDKKEKRDKKEEKDREKDKEREKEKDKVRDKDKDKSKDREKEKEREKDRIPEKEKPVEPIKPSENILDVCPEPTDHPEKEIIEPSHEEAALDLELESAPHHENVDIEPKEDHFIDEDAVASANEEQKSELYDDVLSEGIDNTIVESYGRLDEDGETRTSISPVDINPMKKDTPERPAVKSEKDEDVLELYTGELKTELDKEMLAPVPEPSKWEVDEEPHLTALAAEADSKLDKTKVTQDVLKRAENAIFAKAINAIRPIEIKKISGDRAKLYSGEKEEIFRKDEDIKKEGAQSGSDQEPAPPKEEDIISRPPQRLSVKERLGCKVDELDRIVRIDKPYDRNRSRTLSPLARRSQEMRNTERRVIEIEKRREERNRDRRERNYREKDRERDARYPSREDKERDARDGRGDKRRDRDDKVKERLRGRLGDRDDGRARPPVVASAVVPPASVREDRDKRKRTQSRSRSVDRHAKREREKDRERDRERDDRKKKDKKQRKERDHKEKRDDKDKEKDKERERDKPKDKEREKDRERKRSKDKEKHKDVKGGPARGSSSGREATNNAKVEEKSKDAVGPTPAPPGVKVAEKRKVTLDEENFVPDYDLESEQEQEAKRAESGVEPPKKRRTEKEKESSSNSSSDSSSEDEKKRRKHRKHTKKKKRRESTSSSADSDNSSSSGEEKERSKRKKHKKKSKKKKRAKHK